MSIRQLNDGKMCYFDHFFMLIFKIQCDVMTCSFHQNERFMHSFLLDRDCEKKSLSHL